MTFKTQRTLSTVGYAWYKFVPTSAS